MAGILLHGRERPAEEMIALAERFALPGVRWLAPRAEAGLWYPNRFTDPIEGNEPMLTRSIERCADTVGEASEGGRIDASRIFIVGFSQGACLALEYAQRFPQTCGALVAFTGALMGNDTEVTAQRRTAFDERPVMITGSDVDEWVPEPYVHASADILGQCGARVVMRSYPQRPHSICEAEIADAGEFLAAICAAERAWFLKKRLRSLIA